MNRFLVSVALGGAAMAAAPSPAAHADPAKLKVAVVPGIAVNLDASRVDSLGQDLAEALTSQLDVDAVGGLEVRRALPADLPADCVTTPACVADVAKRTGAQQLLFVVMVDNGAGGSIQVDATWIDAATDRSAQRPAFDIDNRTEARARFESVAHKLLPDAPLRAKTGPIGPTGPVGPIAPAAVARHFTGASVTLGVVGIVGLGAGLAFGLATRSSYNDCDASGTCSSSKRDSIRTTGYVADASWIVGLGALVASGILYATSGHEAGVVVTPTEGGGAAVTAIGRF